MQQPSTLVRVKLQKYSQQRHWNMENGKYPNQHLLDLSVVYSNAPDHPNYKFSVLSGGTSLQLCTINKEAVKQFFNPDGEPDYDSEFDVLISKTQD